MYTFCLMYNVKNVMICIANSRHGDVAAILYEDTRRPGELRDYKEWKYYKEEEECDDHRNFIKITVFVYKKKYLKDKKMMDKLMFMASQFIDIHKWEAQHFVRAVYSKKIKEHFSKNDTIQRRLDIFAEFLENKDSYKKKETSTEIYGHLSQD